MVSLHSPPLLSPQVTQLERGSRSDDIEQWEVPGYTSRGVCPAVARVLSSPPYTTFTRDTPTCDAFGDEYWPYTHAHTVRVSTRTHIQAQCRHLAEANKTPN